MQDIVLTCQNDAENLIGNALIDPLYWMARANYSGIKASAVGKHSTKAAIVYAAMLEMEKAGEPIDVLTVIEKLKKKNMLLDVGGEEYVLGLSEDADIHFQEDWGLHAREGGGLAVTRNEFVVATFSSKHEALEYMYLKIKEIHPGWNDERIRIETIDAEIDALERRREVLEKLRTGYELQWMKQAGMDIEAIKKMRDILLKEETPSEDQK